MTDEQFDKLLNKLDQFQRHYQDNDPSTNISSMDSSLDDIRRDIREIKEMLEQKFSQD